MSTFTAKFNVTGKQRKELVNHIAEAMNCPAKYLGAPSFGYQVNNTIIDRYGTVIFDDNADIEEIKHFLSYLEELGYTAEHEENEEAKVEPDEEENALQPENVGLTIRVPKDNADLYHLHLILIGKGALIKQALDLDDLPIEEENEEIVFPWFADISILSADEIKAYTDFIGKLCEFSKNAKRVSMKAKAVENEKYAFRCFLLRLGFIGTEYKTDRKILLRNLDGSSAFRDGGADDENAE